MRFILILLFTAVIQSAWATQQYISIDGPNCLNGALVASKMLPAHRYSSNSEMRINLKSGMCQKIANQNRKVGDIGLIFDLGPFADKEVISHAFVYISNEVSFEKRGYAQTEPYHLVATKIILEDYDVENILSAEVEFYRCQDWKSFYASEKKSLSVELNKKLVEVENLEEMLQVAIAKNDKNFSQVKKQILKISAGMSEIQTKSGQIFVEIIAARIVSISSQLNALGDPSLRAHTFKWETSSKNISDLFLVLSLNISFNDIN